MGQIFCSEKSDGPSKIRTRDPLILSLTTRPPSLFMSSADNLCKQFEPRSSPTKCWPDLDPSCLKKLTSDTTWR